jgi:predicted nucleotidyltransferase
MKLLSNSNPTSIEWLNSDIVYYGSNNLPIKQYVLENYNPKTLIYHYISLCKKHYFRHINENKKVTHKMYLYMIRGLLNALYVYKKNLIPPLDFTKTIELLKEDIPVDVYNTVKEIIEIKSKGLEKDSVERIEILDAFIDEYMKRTFEIPERKIDINILDEFMKNEILNKNETCLQKIKKYFRKN